MPVNSLDRTTSSKKNKVIESPVRLSFIFQCDRRKGFHTLFLSKLSDGMIKKGIVCQPLEYQWLDLEAEGAVLLFDSASSHTSKHSALQIG